jgi:hypothetical protein
MVLYNDGFREGYTHALVSFPIYKTFAAVIVVGLVFNKTRKCTIIFIVLLLYILSFFYTAIYFCF